METLGINPVGASRDVVAPKANRRRRLRHRVHTPAYAALNRSCRDRSTELSEVINISEEGLAFQASAPFAPDQTVGLCLDLSETGARIDLAGKIIWQCDGRVGISFQGISDTAQRQLREWLFVNNILACVHHEQEAQTPKPELQPRPLPLETRFDRDASLLADFSFTLAALDAVEKEVANLRGMLDLALSLITERALTFVRATGAALALRAGEDVICKASAGPDAPPLGTRLKIGEGFSGECIRSGKLLLCNDTEADPLVDKESCRALGIRSIVAVPIRVQTEVRGLLEVFSPGTAAFRAMDEVVLKRLAAMISDAIQRSESHEDPNPPAQHFDEEVYSEMPSVSILPAMSSIRTWLLVAAAVTLVAAAAWLAQPWKRSERLTPTAAARSGPVNSIPAASAHETFADLRALAEKGDPVAEFALGAHYATGEDVAKSYEQAADWFAKAAEQGHVGAQATLGAYYFSGVGVQRDLVKAYFWAVLAQAGGDDGSKYRVAFLTSHMTRSQVLQAQQQADQWLRDHESTLTTSATHLK